MRVVHRPRSVRAVTSHGALRGLASAAVVIAGTLGLAGCAVDESPVVFAAPASFTDVAPELIEAYQSTHPGTEITLTLASSARLVQQVNAGHRADVLVTADVAALEALDPGTGYERLGTVAENGLMLVTSESTALPAGVEGAAAEGADAALAAWLPDITVALCAPDVPCGRAAHAWLQDHEAESIREDASLESNVRQVLTKVSEGQAEAGFVYTTDAAAAPQLNAVPLDAPVNEYPVLVPASAAAEAPGADFARWLMTEPAQDLLASAGFEVPDAAAGEDGP
ncbi:molybdate ABC transporter substrate-binding protein [Zhihengliuella flava]|uniref:Molybdate transport system substrate-binding protein n=1 Tax=Zhihengliuella flava TaxID=1285193 RepID=A0A931GEQ0_9MICC|nr:molybdate ABC transporter substrate-binding protein [Zhihengliuella flava]MBG6083792.1 molybdate transport system substrate-binding protein [Zhihengliuella flava]